MEIVRVDLPHCRLLELVALKSLLSQHHWMAILPHGPGLKMSSRPGELSKLVSLPDDHPLFQVALM